MKLPILILILFFLLSPAASQSPPSPGTDPTTLSGDFSPSMGVIVIILIAALLFMGFFSIYIRHCSEDEASVRGRITVIRSRRMVLRGLDAEVIESFPTFDYSAVKELKIGKGALECAVCLNEFEDNETLRLIPKCDHVFHPECIDAWLVQHTTCPVCRASLELGPEAHQAEAQHEVEIVEAEPVERPTEPLNPSRTRGKWFGKFSRSNTTGHVAVKQWENLDRFTLRLPEEVRRQIMSGKLSRTTSCVGLPNRPVWSGEGSNRGSGRFDRTGRSDRWVFSLMPPFFSRASSMKSPKGTASVGGSVRSMKAADSFHGLAEPRLPPV